MKLYPVNVIDFVDMFPTDRACFEYLCLVRWPDGFVCPHCGDCKAWKPKRYILRCKSCKKDVSVMAGTIFQDLRKPLRLMFQAMWHTVGQKQGVSALGLQQALGVRKLSHCLELASQTQNSYGETRERSLVWHGRSGRNYGGWKTTR